MSSIGYCSVLHACSCNETITAGLLRSGLEVSAPSNGGREYKGKNHLKLYLLGKNWVGVSTHATHLVSPWELFQHSLHLSRTDIMHNLLWAVQIVSCTSAPTE